MRIRAERPEDYNSILRLTYEAFLTLDFPGRQRMDEHYLVSLLRGSKFVIPELCFVADLNGDFVGHILYTKSEVWQADGTKIPTITFGPLSVLPKYHRQGIGAALVRHSLEKAKELGFCAVLILGVPEYYPKLGFKRAREYGLSLPDGTVPDAFMAYELTPGSLNGGGVFHLLAPEYELAATDNAGYEHFHKKFMSENYHAQLRLRPLWDGDVDLFARWLNLSHIAKWYAHPGQWLHEVRNRRGEFSFIKHFIAEVNGVPIGFGQYYDCFNGQAYEDWYRIEKPGEVFSIDYFVGDPQYLRKGYGSEIVRRLTLAVGSLAAKKIIVRPDAENIASKRVLEANGYILNGQDYVKKLGRQVVSK